MKVLVAYASRHGATAGIAEAIGKGLAARGHEVDVADVEDVATVDDYEAFVLGSAAYIFHWLKPATVFARRYRPILEDRPLWLFSSGPLGTDLFDADGNDVFEAARPKDWVTLIDTLQPRGTKVFFGAWDPDAPPVGMAERLMKHLPASAETLPSGDFRDWAAIDEWAEEIADGLALLSSSGTR